MFTLNKSGTGMILYDNGDKVYYVNHFLHREDGPALDYVSGYRAWFINGKEFAEKDFFKALKLKAFW